ncbi:MAG TPA: translation initiation factor IF-2 [Tissierellaceae bacterium]
MSNMRIYELAKELKLSSKELLDQLEELEMDVSSHMSTITSEEAQVIKELILGSSDNDDSEESTDEELEALMDEEIENIEEEDDTLKLELDETVVVRELAELLDTDVAGIITKLIALGIMASQNQSIDREVAEMIAEEYGYKVVAKQDEEKLDIEEFDLDFEDKKEDLIPRAPVVTVMGHVDHGKTSLLDAIRKANVTTGEAGGITQHIGAYSVNVSKKDRIVFLDTPGHEAFTSMRARGTQVTDIAILVVAADDGVMPQTIEAINHAKAAHVPIIVAINKVDKPEANIDRIYQELVENGLMPEAWGGDVITVPVSAKKGEGIDELLEMVLLVAEMEELKANPNRTAVATIIEAELDKGKGPLATVLVQKGTLKVGDSIVSGVASGRVRAMIDDQGRMLKKAGPSTPVVLLGLSEVPNAGDLLFSVSEEKRAKAFADRRREQIRDEQLKTTSKVSLDDLFERIQEGEIQDLNIIIKADVRGSIEALRQSLEKLNHDEVNVNVIHGGVGGVTESDVMLASASNAIIIGFNVRPNLNAMEVSKREQVDIRTYRVIYEAIEDIQAAVRGMLAPDIVEEVTGRAEVRDTFKLPNNSVVAGIYVLSGKILRHGKVRLLRDDVVIFEGDISSLRRFKDDVREVAAGYEAGLGFENYNDIRVGDYIEAYILKEVKR